MTYYQIILGNGITHFSNSKNLESNIAFLKNQGWEISRVEKKNVYQYLVYGFVTHSVFGKNKTEIVAKRPDLKKVKLVRTKFDVPDEYIPGYKETIVRNYKIDANWN